MLYIIRDTEGKSLFEDGLVVWFDTRDEARHYIETHPGFFYTPEKSLEFFPSVAEINAEIVRSGHSTEIVVRMLSTEDVEILLCDCGMEFETPEAWAKHVGEIIRREA